MLKRWRSLFRVLVRRTDFEDNMSEELRFHIEQYTDDLVRSGVSPEEAAIAMARRLSVTLARRNASRLCEYLRSFSLLLGSVR